MATPLMVLNPPSLTRALKSKLIVGIGFLPALSLNFFERAMWFMGTCPVKKRNEMRRETEE